MTAEKQQSQPSDDAINKMMSVRNVLGMSEYKVPGQEEQSTTKAKKKTSGGSKGHWFNQNIANIFTYIRFALIPFIIFFYAGSSIFTSSDFFYVYGRLIGLILYVVACLTDLIDGWVARTFNQITELGKIIDPIADKCLQLTGFTLILTDVELIGHVLPVWFAVLIVVILIGRDFSVNVVRQMAALKGKVLQADWTGKVKSAVLYTTMALLMFFSFDGANNNKIFGAGLGWNIMTGSCIALLTISAGLTIYSLYAYFRRYTKM